MSIAAREDHLAAFYEILRALEKGLGGNRCLKDCGGRLAWPRRGIYFFQERDEFRTRSGEGPRIVRVGTHALKAGSRTTLWNRLSQHKGTSKSGGGNHRGSIFRLIVGAAIMQRDDLKYPSWGSGSSAPREIRDSEVPLEKKVSRAIGEMPFLWLAVEDDPGAASLRGYIERNSIALLSNVGRDPIDPPSPGWLGNHSNRARVRASGLWNQNHVDETYDPAFLDVLGRLVVDMPRPG
jgi:hypothetical protein